MKKIVVKYVICLVCIMWGFTYAYGADKGKFSTSPKTNSGKKWRIGYYEGGHYIDYTQTLVATINGLMELGWIETTQIPIQTSEKTSEIWKWAGTVAVSNYIEFVQDAYYSAGWNKETRKELASKIIERLSKTKDIDLMIAMGTWAGQDLANTNHEIPVIVESTSDPIASKIIKSIEDSGYDHVHARVDPSRYERQVRTFHDIINFKKLGVAYKDDDAGRSYAAIDKVEKIAKERGFEIVRCLMNELDEENTKKCLHELGKKADAIYVTEQKGINKKSLPEIVKIINEYRIPTFSQAGSDQVKAGLLMSISVASHKYEGKFHAETIAKVLNGAKPRQLDQIFEDPPKIAINIKTAQIIGYDPPVDVLSVADEIYQDIINPE